MLEGKLRQYEKQKTEDRRQKTEERKEGKEFRTLLSVF